MLRSQFNSIQNVKIVKQMDDGRVIDVAILGKGDYFGELALINHKPRAASVYASEYHYPISMPHKLCSRWLLWCQRIEHLN